MRLLNPPQSGRWVAICMLVLTLLAVSLQAQNQPVIEGATPVDRNLAEASALLGATFKKEAEGYRLAFPAGARVIDRQGVDLASFVVDNKRWAGTLQRITLEKAVPLQELLESRKADLGKDPMFSGVQVRESRLLDFQSYRAGRLVMSMELQVGGGQPTEIARQLGLQTGARTESLSLLRQQLFVQTKDRQYMILTFYTPLKDADIAIRTFDAMLREFEIYNPETMKQRRTDAIRLGRAWLAERTAENYRARLINETQTFRILVGKEDVGFIKFREFAQLPHPQTGALVDVERDARKGVLLTVEYHSFPAEGKVTGENEAFLANSRDSRGDLLGHYSSWINISRTRVRISTAATPQRPASIEIVEPWLQETGILVHEGLPRPGAGGVSDVPFRITVNLSGDRTQRVPPGVNMLLPREILDTIAPEPLPKIFEYSWTRFVDLTRPAEMSFVVFDSGARKLTMRTLIVTGQKETLTINGQATSCYKCIDELDPNSTTLWVDAAGRIQMMRTSDQSIMIPTTEQEMKARWEKRLQEQ